MDFTPKAPLPASIHFADADAEAVFRGCLEDLGLPEPQQYDHEQRLRLQTLTGSVYQHPTDGNLWAERAELFLTIQYPELAAGDACRALKIADRQHNDEDRERAIRLLAAALYFTHAFNDCRKALQLLPWYLELGGRTDLWGLNNEALQAQVLRHYDETGTEGLDLDTTLQSACFQLGSLTNAPQPWMPLQVRSFLHQAKVPPATLCCEFVLPPHLENQPGRAQARARHTIPGGIRLRVHAIDIAPSEEDIVRRFMTRLVGWVLEDAQNEPFDFPALQLLPPGAGEPYKAFDFSNSVQRPLDLMLESVGTSALSNPWLDTWVLSTVANMVRYNVALAPANEEEEPWCVLSPELCGFVRVVDGTGNVEVECDGENVVLRACRDIEQGERLAY